MTTIIIFIIFGSSWPFYLWQQWSWNHNNSSSSSKCRINYRLNAGKLTIPQLYYCPCYKCSCFLCIPTGVSLGVILAYVLVNFLIECDLNYCLDITSCDIGLFSAEVAGITMHLTFGCASISFTVDTILVIVRVVFKRTVIRVLIT